MGDFNVPCGGLGGIGECAGLDIECAAAGRSSPLFFVCGKKNPGELLFSPGGIGWMSEGDICHFLFFVFEPCFEAFDCLVEFGGAEC